MASSNCCRVISIRGGHAAIVAGHGGLGPGGERPLGVFALPPQLARRAGVLARIDAVLRGEGLGHQVDQPLVPVVAAQVHVAVGGQGDELACRGSP